MKFLLITIAALITSGSFWLSRQENQVAPKGKVQISSLNVKDEIVPFIDVIIEGNGIRRELKSVGVGEEYENGGLVELPVGAYRITSRNGNYFEFRRAAFQVRPGVVTRINVDPALMVQLQMLMSDGSDRYVFAPKPAYDEYSVPHGPDQALRMLVRYYKKHTTRDYVDYERVMVSYDALAAYADRIRFDRKKFTLGADGNVIVEDGTQRVKVKSVTITFNNGAPKVAAN